LAWNVESDSALLDQRLSVTYLNFFAYEEVDEMVLSQTGNSCDSPPRLSVLYSYLWNVVGDEKESAFVHEF